MAEECISTPVRHHDSLAALHQQQSARKRLAPCSRKRACATSHPKLHQVVSDEELPFKKRRNAVADCADVPARDTGQEQQHFFDNADDEVVACTPVAPRNNRRRRSSADLCSSPVGTPTPTASAVPRCLLSAGCSPWQSPRRSYRFGGEDPVRPATVAEKVTVEQGQTEDCQSPLHEMCSPPQRLRRLLEIVSNLSSQPDSPTDDPTGTASSHGDPADCCPSSPVTAVVLMDEDSVPVTPRPSRPPLGNELPETPQAPLRIGRSRRTLLGGITSGDVHVVEDALRAGEDPNMESGFPPHHTRMLPLLAAATRGQASIVKALLDGGAVIDSVNCRGQTALHLACDRDHQEEELEAAAVPYVSSHSVEEHGVPSVWSDLTQFLDSIATPPCDGEDEEPEKENHLSSAVSSSSGSPLSTPTLRPLAPLRSAAAARSGTMPHESDLLETVQTLLAAGIDIRLDMAGKSALDYARASGLTQVATLLSRPTHVRPVVRQLTLPLYRRRTPREDRSSEREHSPGQDASSSTPVVTPKDRRKRLGHHGGSSSTSRSGLSASKRQHHRPPLPPQSSSPSSSTSSPKRYPSHAVPTAKLPATLLETRHHP